MTQQWIEISCKDLKVGDVVIYQSRNATVEVGPMLVGRSNRIRVWTDMGKKEWENGNKKTFVLRDE